MTVRQHTRRRTTAAALAALAVAGGTLVATTGPAAAAPASAPVAAEPAPVASVDVPRYLGRWYQIASVPAFFEVQCLKDVTADYGLNSAGMVSVRNACTSLFGLKSSIKGAAKPLDASNARLNVSFLGLNGTYRHTSDANYIVVGLAPDYSWAVVTDSDRRSGFVLSRTPALPAAATTEAQAALTAAGIDPCTLKKTVQTGANTSRGAFC
ncbi:lipocalin family protein [Streptomyces sp. NPDC060194]|uniref:lipocalin family protein n=1 Tax=Streptomyces sp. NPDC060194 TaxID=3347069 RepID=UPI003655DD0F